MHLKLLYTPIPDKIYKIFIKYNKESYASILYQLPTHLLSPFVAGSGCSIFG